MPKRITVAVTIADGSYYTPRKLKNDMVQAALVRIVTDQADLLAVDAKVGNVRKG
jgi:hypothetical protein